MKTIKIVGRNYIFSPLCLIKAVHKNANNHECDMVTKSLQLGLQDFTRINNYAYSGRLLKFVIFESQRK